MATPQTQRSVPEVLQDIVSNLQDIIRSEFSLAKAEIKEEGTKAAKPIATFGVGLVAAFYGVGFLLLATVYAMSRVMANWLSALLVGCVLAVAGIALLSSSGRKLNRVNSSPNRTTQSLKENVQWAKQQDR